MLRAPNFVVAMTQASSKLNSPIRPPPTSTSSRSMIPIFSATASTIRPRIFRAASSAAFPAMKVTRDE